MAKQSHGQNNKNPASPPRACSLWKYSYQVEKEVVVRYWQGQPIQLVHPPHLTCLQSIEPKSLKRVGRPAKENTIRYLLNRALFNYLYVPKDTPPQPLSRYGLATLALKRCKQERNRIHAFIKTPAKRKEKLVKQFSISRQTIENFLKHFFTEPEQRLSPNELRELLPQLSYRRQLALQHTRKPLISFLGYP